MTRSHKDVLRAGSTLILLSYAYFIYKRCSIEPWIDESKVTNKHLVIRGNLKVIAHRNCHSSGSHRHGIAVRDPAFKRMERDLKLRARFKRVRSV